MLVSVVSLATVCLAWLVLVSARPSGHHRDQLMAGQAGQAGPEERGLRAPEPLPDTAAAPATHTDTQAQRAWDKFIHFVHKQKPPQGRSRKGPTKGCFRMRMDRIGSMSKLGC